MEENYKITCLFLRVYQFHLFLMASFFKANSSSSSSSSNTKLKEEINISDINQDINNWKIPKYTQSNICEKDKKKWMFSTTNYTIKVVNKKYP